MTGCLLTVIFLFIYVLCLILFSKFNIIICGELKDLDFSGHIDFELYGLKLYTLSLGNKPQEKKRDKSSLFLNREHFYRCIEHYTIEILDLDIKVGLDDAANTAVSVGVFHSIISCLYAFLSNHIRIHKINSDIKPIYSVSCFEFNFLCIIEVKVVNIIIDVLYVRLKFLWDSYKDKIGRLRQWSEHKNLKGRVEYG